MYIGHLVHGSGKVQFELFNFKAHFLTAADLHMLVFQTKNIGFAEKILIILLDDHNSAIT